LQKAKEKRDLENCFVQLICSKFDILLVVSGKIFGELSLVLRILAWGYLVILGGLLSVIGI